MIRFDLFIFELMRRWWVKIQILHQTQYPGMTLKQLSDYWAEGASELFDFEYNFPQPDSFAYLWHAIGPWEICSALTAMQRMQELSKGSKANIDFLLVFVHSVNESNQDEYELSDQLATKWESVGGQAEEVVVSRKKVRRNHM